MERQRTVPKAASVKLGHTSAETAYVIESYPYGHLRCQKRVWVECGTKGNTKQQARIVEQTNNPRLTTKPWNKPKCSVYVDFAMLYLDEIGHVQFAALTFYDTPQTFATFEALIEQLDDTATTAQFAQAKRRARSANPLAWQLADLAH